MVAEKYRESAFLVSQKDSLPGKTQQIIVVSDEEKRLAKECVLYTKFQLKDKKIRPWIPYGQILGEVINADKGTDVRRAREYSIY